MATFDLPYTKTAKGGRYVYFRRGNEKMVRLPGMPGSREFMKVYEACLKGEAPEAAENRLDPRSFGALVRSYYASTAFHNLTPASQTNYRRALDKIVAEKGQAAVADLRPKHIYKLMDDRRETPGASYKMLSVLKVVLSFAVERGWRDDNPASTIRKPKYKEQPFETWSDSDIAAFENRWPVGTVQHLAMALMLYLGQRRSDVIRLSWSDMSDGYFCLTQQKTNIQLFIPVHPNLQECLDTVEADRPYFLLTQYGNPFATTNSFYGWFARACRQAGLPEGLSPHGLRKAAARRLAEAGASELEIRAVTGHASSKQLTVYVEKADRRKLATSG